MEPESYLEPNLMSTSTHIWFGHIKYPRDEKNTRTRFHEIYDFYIFHLKYENTKTIHSSTVPRSKIIMKIACQDLSLSLWVMCQSIYKPIFGKIFFTSWRAVVD